MKSLQVRTGQISLQILDDLGNPRGVFTFNPEDVASAKQVFLLQQQLEEKQKEFDSKLEASDEVGYRIDLLNEIITYFNGAIDRCFGQGSSEVLFGGAKTLSMYTDFFEGITPYYQDASRKRMDKYQQSDK